MATYNGTSGNDTYTGTATADQIDGNGGDDTLHGLGGDDLMFGGIGADTLNGGDGDDELFSEDLDGFDFNADGSFDNRTSIDTLNGGAGNDVIGGGLGDTLDGGTGTDVLILSLAAATSGVTGSLAAAFSGGVATFGGGTLSGFERYSKIAGSQFGDTVTVGDGVEVNDGTAYRGIYGNGGNDVLTGGSQANSLYGGNDNDTLNGLGGDDYIQGDAGADTLNGGAGDDRLIGGTGFDTATYNDATAAVQVSLLLTTAQNTGGAGTDTLTEIENLTGTAFADTLTGNNAVNVLSGLAGNDTLSAGIGNDTLDGGSGTDTMTGGTGDDIYVVDRAADIVVEAAGEGTDTVRTTALALTLVANVEALTFIGTGDFAGTGNVLANTLTGGAGSDTLDGAGGTDTMTGGLGDDTYVVDDGGDVVVELAGEGTDSVRTTLASYTLAAPLENLAFTGAGNFAGTGNAAANVITGGAGNDVLVGLGGNDRLVGAAGNDTLNGGAASDTADYGDAAGGVTVSLLLAGAQNTGGAGTDTLIAIESLIGSAFADTLTGTAAANALRGGAGDDTIDGGAGDDLIDGGAGSDTAIYAGAGAGVTISLALFGAQDTLGAGVDTLAGIEHLVGSAFADRLTGNVSVNSLSGGGGNDILNGGGGIDAMIGGAGDDTYIVDDSADAITELADEGTDSVIATALAYTLAANVETLSFGGVGDFTGTGNALANSITGGAGADVLDGADGADVIRGGGGIDAILGGAGDDAFLIDGVADFGAGESYDGGDGTDTLLLNYNADSDISGLLLSDVEAVEQTYFSHDTRLTAAQLDALARVSGTSFTLTTGGTVALAGASLNVETFVLADIATSFDLTGSTQSYGITVTGGSAADTITGDDAADILLGGGGNDVLTGGAENDTLDGGTGSDRMTGGTGDDLYRIDATGDRVTEAAGEGYDTVESTLAYRLGLNVEALTLTGAAAISGIGNTLDNTLTGNASANVLSGLDGADTLIGGGGNDSLNGGLGADTLVGGAGDDVYTIDNAGDTVTEAAGEGYDSVTAGVDHTLGANFERLVLTGAARIGTGNALDNSILGGGGGDTLGGGDGADTIQAGSGNDLIAGDAGNDILDGGAGRDLMTGGTGADRFVFRPGDTGTTLSTADVITDFSHAQGDRVSVALIDAIAGTPADDRFAFIGTNAFGGVAGQLRYEVSGNFTYIHGDTNGDAVSDLVIRLNGAMPLVAADFQL